MGDPLSIIASSASLVDLSIKVVKFIRQTKKGTDTIDDDLGQLLGDIENLRNTGEQIRNAYKREVNDASIASKTDDDATASIWMEVSGALHDCDAALNDIDAKLIEIIGKPGSSALDKLKRYFRNLSKQDEIAKSWRKLDKGHQVLQMSLTLLNIIVTRQSQVGTSRSNDELSMQMSKMAGKLDDQISALERAIGSSDHTVQGRDGIVTAKSIQKLAWVNAHFMVPQAVNNLFMGRESDLQTLSQAVEGFKEVRGTKRVVIYGLGGSGKTQFCCKFAQEKRSSFWGVFYIDASTSASIQYTYGLIAERAKIEPKEGNVKHWLSEQTKPWLLIIDNADEHLRSHPPQNFIPESECGLVLFTTRNHSLRMHGHFNMKFSGLEEGQASMLLLTSAGILEPFEPTMLQAAAEVCRRFGFLPIAILHAGKAILEGKSTVANCLSDIERSLTRVRDVVRYGKATVAGPDFTADDAVYATFELVIPAAREDALQLLKLLSFMHSQQFPFQILLRAIVNPQRLTALRQSPPKAATPSRARRKSMVQVLQELARKLYSLLEQLGERPALPAVLRSLQHADPGTAEQHLRELLSHLMGLALLDYNDAADTYSMHTAVHWWIQASMTYQEKAVWCQAACNVLALGILLPPEGIEDDDVQWRRYALPHVEYARKQEQRLQDELQAKQKRRQRAWPVMEPILQKSRIERDAKFSLVYAECGMWRKARKLMSGIDSWLVQTVGLDNPVAIRARLFLSETYWWLGEVDEAVRLQFELLYACKSSLGAEDVDTLIVMDRLGSSSWQQGRFLRARDFCQEAVDGFEKAYPQGHIDKFRAMTNLGRCFGKLAEFDRAVAIHSEALDGLLQAQKDSGLKYETQILDVQENLAMARHDRHRYGKAQTDDLAEAAKLEGAVFEKHENKLGKEHPKTLWAACNLARIKATMGELEEAEDMMRKGLLVAKRTVGEDHLGTLMGETYLGQIVTLAGKLDEAEQILCDVMEKYRSRDGTRIEDMHPDHFVAATLMLDCYRRQKKHQDADRLESIVMQGIKFLFGDGSPWETYFVGHYTVAGATQHQ